MNKWWSALYTPWMQTWSYWKNIKTSTFWIRLEHTHPLCSPYRNTVCTYGNTSSRADTDAVYTFIRLWDMKQSRPLICTVVLCIVRTDAINLTVWYLTFRRFLLSPKAKNKTFHILHKVLHILKSSAVRLWDSVVSAKDLAFCIIRKHSALKVTLLVN